MRQRAWFNNDRQLTPGAELYRSERTFSLWAHTASHGQTLLRSPAGPDSRGREHDTLVDVLFKPVTVMKVRERYTGLLIRCATLDEAEEIRSATSSVSFRRDDRFFVLESEGDIDYVVAMAVGWNEDHGESGDEPSYFAGLDESDYSLWTPGRRVLFGVDGGLGGNVAPVQELFDALCSETSPRLDRNRYRYVYLVAARFPNPEDEGTHIKNLGAFLTQAEAEDAQAWLAARYPDCWIEMVPIAL